MSEENKKNTLLVVDDDEGVCISIKEILSNRFTTYLANSAKKALDLLNNNSNGKSCFIDLVISDICMEHLDGLELLRIVKENNPRVEVIIMTGYSNPENTVKALRFGASDYIVKPFKADDVIESVDRVLSKRKEAIKIDKLIEDLRIAIQKNYLDTTEALIMAIDAKDNYTKEHCTRVASLMVKFAKKIGLNDEETELLRKVSNLHDIGKIGIKEEILNKVGCLTREEWDEMKKHAYIGYQIIQPVEFLGKGRDVLLYHQERYDGSGYPAALKGDKIPLGARMLAIVDSYDAMTTDRPYREKMSLEKALDEVKKYSGKQFDPKLTKVFIEMMMQKRGK